MLGSLFLIILLFHFTSFLFPFLLNEILPLSNPLYDPTLFMTLPFLSVLAPPLCFPFGLLHLLFYLGESYELSRAQQPLATHVNDPSSQRARLLDAALLHLSYVLTLRGGHPHTK